MAAEFGDGFGAAVDLEFFVAASVFPVSSTAMRGRRCAPATPLSPEKNPLTPERGIGYWLLVIGYWLRG
jgi:hypothetical protein